MKKKQKESVLRGLTIIRLVKLLCSFGVLFGNAYVASAQQAESIVSNAKPPQNTVVQTVTVGSYPVAIAVSPDNNTVYILNQESNSVTVLDATNAYSIKATTKVASYPLYLALSPDGKSLYVASNITAGVISVIDTTQSTYPVKAQITAGVNPEGLAVSPNGNELYVTNYGQLYNGVPGTVSIFDTGTNMLTTTIKTGGEPFQVLFAKNGKQADILNFDGTGYVQLVDTTSTTISPLVYGGGSISFPNGMTRDPSGTILYIVDGEDYVAQCDANNGRIIKQLLAAPNVSSLYYLGQPAITPNGRYLYVPYAYNNIAGADGNQVVMLDVGNGKAVGNLIAVGNYPAWTEMSPSGQTLYIANSDDDTLTVVNTSPGS